MSSDVNDLKALTSRYFLIGRPKTAIVEDELISIKGNRLARWKNLQYGFSWYERNVGIWNI